MSGLPSGRADLPAATYYYRRHIGTMDLLPALGAGIAAGLAGFYLARIFLQKTPFVRESEIARLDDRGVLVGRRGGSAAGE